LTVRSAVHSSRTISEKESFVFFTDMSGILSTTGTGYLHQCH